MSTPPDLREGMYVAVQRMIGMIRWRLQKCEEQGELSGRIVNRLEEKIEKAQSWVAQEEYSEAIAELTNAAIYLGRYMYVE